MSAGQCISLWLEAEEAVANPREGRLRAKPISRFGGDAIKQGLAMASLTSALAGRKGRRRGRMPIPLRRCR